MRRLFVIGAGGHGAVVADAADESGHWDEIGFLDDDESRDAVLGFPVVGTTDKISSLAGAGAEFVVAVGNNRDRLDLCNLIVEKGFLHHAGEAAAAARQFPREVGQCLAIVFALPEDDCGGLNFCFGAHDRLRCSNREMVSGAHPDH